MVIFGAAHGWGRAKGPPSLKSISHTLQRWNMGQLYLVISRNTDIDCILIVSNSFNFSWVFKDFSNKPGYNFDDVSENGYPRPS